MHSPAVIRWALFLFLSSGKVFSQPPGNDDFANATPISSDRAILSGTTIGATSEPGEPDHTAALGFGAKAANSIWYSWTVTGSGIAQVIVDGEDPQETNFAIYTGSTIDALTSILDVDTFFGTREVGTFEAIAGTTYQIAIQGFSTDGLTAPASPIRLSLAVIPTIPPNDNFASATPLTSFPVSIPGSTISATSEPDEPEPIYLTPSSSRASNSVWYRWQPTEETTLRFTTGIFPSGITLAAFEGESLDDLVQVADSDIFFGNGTETFPLRGLPGLTYHIVVDGGGPDPSGTFILEVEVVPPPENDAFATPGILPPTLPTSSAGTTIASSAEPDEPDHIFTGQNRASDSTWWIWTSPVTARVVVSCRGEILEAILATYQDFSTLSGLVPTGTADEGGSGVRESVTINATEGTTYRIAIDTASEGDNPARYPGDYLLRIDPLPENDNFADAIDFGNAPNVTSDTSSIGATFEPDEPSHGIAVSGNLASNSVWFTWEAPTSESYAFTAFLPEQDAIIAVYTGSHLEDLTLVAEADDIPLGNATEGVTFDTIAGTRYLIAIDTFRGGLIQGSGGLFQLRIRPTSTYGSWIARFPSLNGGDILPTANPANDGIPNLLKLVFGLDPTLPITSDPARASAPTFTLENGIPILRATIAGGIGTIKVTVESSQNLSDWTPIGTLNSGPAAISITPREDRPRSYTRIRAAILD